MYKILNMLVPQACSVFKSLKNQTEALWHVSRKTLLTHYTVGGVIQLQRPAVWAVSTANLGDKK